MRKALTPILFGGGKVSLYNRIQTTQAANLIAYWPMNEASGTAADDKTATDANGVYSGTFTLGQAGIGDGFTSVLLNGANGRVSLAATLAALNTAFSGVQGTLYAWGRIPTAGVWSDGSSDFMIEIGADLNNRVGLYKNNTVPNSISVIYNAAGTGQFPIYTFSSAISSWFVAAVTWDKNAGANGEVKFFVNGVQRDTTKTGLGVWSGALSASWTAIGDLTSSGGSAPWNGLLAHVAVWKVALTPAQILALSTI